MLCCWYAVCMYDHDSGDSMGLELFHYLLSWEQITPVFCDLWGWPWLALPPVGWAQAIFCCMCFCLHQNVTPLKPFHWFRVPIWVLVFARGKWSFFKEVYLVHLPQLPTTSDKSMMCCPYVSESSDPGHDMPCRWWCCRVFWYSWNMGRVSTVSPKSQQGARGSVYLAPSHGGFETVIARLLHERCWWVTWN